MDAKTLAGTSATALEAAVYLAAAQTSLVYVIGGVYHVFGSMGHAAHIVVAGYI